MTDREAVNAMDVAEELEGIVRRAETVVDRMEKLMAELDATDADESSGWMDRVGGFAVLAFALYGVQQAFVHLFGGK